MTNEQIQDFLNEHNYDVRRTRNGRWIDQKCTMDVVCFVADCILDYIDKNHTTTFESPNVWRSQYAKDNVAAVFGKPATDDFAAHDEFNKFFRQPTKMLAAAGILSEYLDGITIQFTVVNRELLEYIALREKNAYNFLCMYIEKVLRDSGLWPSFERFFEAQDAWEFQVLKERFIEFSIANTPMNDKVEPSRIFTKVLNPLACKFHKLGTERGRLSKHIITFDKIAYNQPNWRDELSGKEKNVARSDYSGANNPQPSDYYNYRVGRAMKYLRQFNDLYNAGRSEVTDRFSIGVPATHVHHIFPKGIFKEIADYVENMIVLTSGQHLQEAHPAGNTSIVNRDFQYICLLAKTESIRKNLLANHGEPVIYNFNDFTHVLSVGFCNDYFEYLAENDFNSIVNKLEQFY